MRKEQREQYKKALLAITEEDLEWLSDTDVARYHRDVERVNRPSLLARLTRKPEVSHAKSTQN